MISRKSGMILITAVALLTIHAKMVVVIRQWLVKHSVAKEPWNNHCSYLSIAILFLFLSSANVTGDTQGDSANRFNKSCMSPSKNFDTDSYHDGWCSK